MLSFSRYLSILHKPSWLNRIIEQHSCINVLCCALLAICWTLPPVFGFGNKFIREGVGFYCSLDWKDPSFQSRLFLISVIFFNYFGPFILLFYSNIRIYFTLHGLLKVPIQTTFIVLPMTVCQSETSNTAESGSLSSDSIEEISSEETVNRLQRLKVDRRFAIMTTITAAQYLITWTPYAFLELLNISGRNKFLQHNPFLPTLCALFAKLSLILNPFILIYTNKVTEN